MFQAFRPATRAVAAAALLTSFTVLAPAWAATSPVQLAQAAAPAPAVPTPATTAAQQQKRLSGLDAHIADLHKKLKITAAQEPQWQAFSQVMRDNGQAMETALQARDATKGISAVEDMKSYATIAQAHADGMQKLVPAFQTLYESMTPDQQKNADTVFDQTRHGMAAGKKKS